VFGNLEAVVGEHVCGHHPVRAPEVLGQFEPLVFTSFDFPVLVEHIHRVVRVKNHTLPVFLLEDDRAICHDVDHVFSLSEILLDLFREVLVALQVECGRHALLVVDVPELGVLGVDQDAAVGIEVGYGVLVVLDAYSLP